MSDTDDIGEDSMAEDIGSPMSDDAPRRRRRSDDDDDDDIGSEEDNGSEQKEQDNDDYNDGDRADDSGDAFDEYVRSISWAVLASILTRVLQLLTFRSRSENLFALMPRCYAFHRMKRRGSRTTTETTMTTTTTTTRTVRKRSRRAPASCSHGDARTPPHGSGTSRCCRCVLPLSRVEFNWWRLEVPGEARRGHSGTALG